MTLSARHSMGQSLDSASFRAIADLAYRESGLTLVEEKSSMIQSRLRHRLRALGIEDFPQYCSFVSSSEGQKERRQLISALTTNVSHFFREDHHFDRMCDVLKSRLSAARAGAPLRIWSAGCSNGQEPLSIAMTVLEHLPELARLDFRILATDIDPAVLRFAKRAHYPEKLTSGMPEALRNRYFEADISNPKEPLFSADQKLRAQIRFNELNLLAPWPMKQPFDTIFCRNVVIYFDIETQNKLWPRFRQALRPGGLLFLGHSERIADPERYGFESVGPTTYRPLPDQRTM